MAGVVIASFRPARSFGWLWLLALTLLMVLPLLPLLQPAVLESEDAVGVWIGVGVEVPLAAFFLATLASFPAMRYELTADELLVSCGPLLRYRIPYAEITDVGRTDLAPTLWSSMRMPGLALWSVTYAEVGSVRMCATHMARGILVIGTARCRYGITPADEQAFLSALRPMLGAAAGSRYHSQ